MLSFRGCLVFGDSKLGGRHCRQMEEASGKNKKTTTIFIIFFIFILLLKLVSFPPRKENRRFKLLQIPIIQPQITVSNSSPFRAPVTVTMAVTFKRLVFSKHICLFWERTDSIIFPFTCHSDPESPQLQSFQVKHCFFVKIFSFSSNVFLILFSK